jgi:D-glycero-D-manno-heptose 1,7-bisphosphate phosphatase
MNRAVFLDRDGTINEHSEGYVKSWKEFHFIPNALEALKKLAQSDYKIIIITNQSAVGRGIISRDALEDMHQRMLAKVEEAGGRIDGIFACMHKPDDKCGCRKPSTGLIEMAATAFDIDLKESWLIGDNTLDIKTGRNAGCKTLLVETGYGGRDGNFEVKPDRKARDLAAAAAIILG